MIVAAVASAAAAACGPAPRGGGVTSMSTSMSLACSPSSPQAAASLPRTTTLVRRAGSALSSARAAGLLGRRAGSARASLAAVVAGVEGVGDAEGAEEEGLPAWLEGPVWLPPPPDLGGKKPRASWNPAALAFLGDGVWELYARRAHFAPPRRPRDYAVAVKKEVMAEAQAVYVEVLVGDEFLTQEELQVMRWGYNSGTASAGSPKRLKSGNLGGTGVYRTATGLEVLTGYLYLTDPGRLDAMMEHLGLGGGGAAERGAVASE